MSFSSPSGGFSSRSGSALRHGVRRVLVGSTAIIVASGLGVASAQEAPEGARNIVFEFGQFLEWSDNPDLTVTSDDRFTSRTALGFGFQRRTRTDLVALSLGTDYELRDDGDDRFSSSRLRLSWERETSRANTALVFDVREVDLGTATITDLDTDTGSIDFGTVDEGTRRTSDLSFAAEVGVDSPIGGTIGVAQRQIRYEDTIDPDLLDADRMTIEGSVLFRPETRLTVGVIASQIDFDEDGPGEIDTLTTRLSSFLAAEITPTLTGRFELGYEEVEETGANDITRDGAIFDVSLVQTRPSGSHSLDATSVLTTAGRRNSLSYGQIYTLPAAELGFSLGVTQTDGADAEPLIGFDWAQELPRGTFRVSLEQAAFTDRDTNSQINSRLSVGYDQDLTRRSGFGVDVNFLDINELDDGERDRQRLNVGLSYRYELTPDWDLTSGVTFVRALEDGAPDRESSTISVGVTRTFAFN